ncbi:MAG: asparagine synthase (glutamine-hydrolyzing) [Elusimicrobia bacterium]|nr:asparagine synthase (glutamine-hydrolyzing) [Elusimicrobiota bacterium]
MCGICGVFSLDGRPINPSVVRVMRDALTHRGPDDEGEYFGEGVGLGFRRLSILDLERGHQPMQTQKGSLTLVYNGEIYNHLEIRSRLESSGVRFRTHSDTETALHLFEQRGKEALREFNGMFAMGLWDSSARELLLARDPMGIKPLYYTVHEGKLYFSSELRALLRSGVGVRLDPVGLWDYLSFGYVHSPRTILTGIYKLPAGVGLTVSRAGLKFEKFWEVSVADGSSLPQKSASGFSEQEVLEELEPLLQSSVKNQMLSDVPVGAFLSGGIDSSLVTALMSRVSSRPVQTFTIGFKPTSKDYKASAGLDESDHAREVARYLGTDHHEVILPMNVLGQVEKLLPCLDEPIGDSAILPTYLLSAFAREKVKVVLTGEGADELFAGYGRYKSAYLSRYFEKHPSWWASWGKRLLGQKASVRTIRDWVEVAQHSSVPSQGQYLTASLRERLCQEIGRGLSFSPSGFLPEKGNWDWATSLEFLKGFNGILAFDLKTVLADCLLMKVDKSTMQASLEARVPFLDKKVVEFALRIPPELKIRFFRSKWILRKLAKKYLPGPIVARRKHGFWVPWEEWVRDPWNEAVESVFHDSVWDKDLFQVEQLQKDLKILRRGGREVDSGVFFRLAILGLWLQAIKRVDKFVSL